MWQHIDMYDDRIEITNPGGMLEGKPIQDRNPRKVPSKIRNPIIADVFDRANYMERRGSGFKKILNYAAQVSAQVTAQVTEEDILGYCIKPRTKSIIHGRYSQL